MLIGRLQGVPDETDAFDVHPHAADHAGVAVDQSSKLVFCWRDAEEDRFVPVVDVPALTDVGRAIDRAAAGGGKGGADLTLIESLIKPVTTSLVEAVEEPDFLDRDP